MALLDGWWKLVRLGFRLLYHELAFTYDSVSAVVSLGAWRCWQRSLLPHLTDVAAGRVLELAHGTGNLQLDLAAVGYASVALDFSAQMGDIAQRKLQRHGLSMRLVRGTALHLPFPDAAFAAVVSTFPTSFILEPETLAEIARVLQADGVVLIVPNGVFKGAGLAGWVLEWAYRMTGQREGGTFDAVGYFAAHGFMAEVLQVPCPRSVATVIKMRKNSSGIYDFA